eukprot:4289-Pleurochrysis_carterae.AAC.1
MMAAATLKRQRWVNTRKKSRAHVYTRGSCAALRVERRTLASERVGRRRSLEGRGTLLATCCAHAFAAAKAHKRAASSLQHAVSQAVSKATTVTATMAEM